MAQFKPSPAPTYGGSLTGATLPSPGLSCLQCDAISVINDTFDFIKNCALAHRTPWWFPTEKGVIDLDQLALAAKDTICGMSSISEDDMWDSLSRAITGAVEKLYKIDGHSGFIPVGSRLSLSSKEITVAFEQLNGTEVCRISIPHCRVQSVTDCEVQAIVKGIKEAEEKRVAGYILDLRGNIGGNMWPILEALSPLIEGDEIGFSVVPKKGSVVAPPNRTDQQPVKDDYVRENWDQLSLGEHLRWRRGVYACSDATTSVNQKPIALCQDNNTASSGEQILLAFRGQKNAQSIGTPSYGLTTGNSTYCVQFRGQSLTIYIAGAFTMDRNKILYYEKVQPEVTISGDEAAFKTATSKWFQQQSGATTTYGATP